MTDTCNTVRKYRCLLYVVIETEGEEQGISPDEINVYEADCWHHLQNVWIGVVVLKLGKHLTEMLKRDLKATPFLLCGTTNVANVRIATEKYFGNQANYNKVS